MKIVTVSGSASGTGKTCVAGELLRNLKNWSALKVTVARKGTCPRKKSCGICNRLTNKFSIVTDQTVILEPGKDTRRLRDSGAKEVIWLQATPGGLKQGLRQAIARFKNAPGLIIEGTSVLKYLRPDLGIFVKGKNKVLKPSARIAFKKADIVIEA